MPKVTKRLVDSLKPDPRREVQGTRAVKATAEGVVRAIGQAVHRDNQDGDGATIKMRH